MDTLDPGPHGPTVRPEMKHRDITDEITHMTRLVDESSRLARGSSRHIRHPGRWQFLVLSGAQQTNTATRSDRAPSRSLNSVAMAPTVCRLHICHSDGANRLAGMPLKASRLHPRPIRGRDARAARPGTAAQTTGGRDQSLKLPPLSRPADVATDQRSGLSGDLTNCWAAATSSCRNCCNASPATTISREMTSSR